MLRYHRGGLGLGAYFLFGLTCVGFLITSLTGLAAKKLKASRDAEPGCHWKPFESRDLGIRLLVQDCPQPEMHYEFSVRGSTLEQHRPSDDTTFSSHFVLQVFSKAPGQSIEQAIKSQFISKLKDEAKGSCRVKRLTVSPLRNGRVAYTITPVGKYERKIQSELEKAPRNFGCGDYGKDQELTYFEYHPKERRNKFLFVIYGWDSEHPNFDENSIQFTR